MRAFTVQSNMKRHMRVCKHKPLSPPMSPCEIVSAASPSLPSTSPTFPLSFQGISSFGVGLVTNFSNSRSSVPGAMHHIDRSNSLILGGSGGASPSTSTHPRFSASPSDLSAPMISTPSGNVQMIPFERPQFVPYAQLRLASPPTFKGYRAPMIIAAMFSVQQNVPTSLARLALVHMECTTPLLPVTLHPMYVGWYSKVSGSTTENVKPPGMCYTRF